MTNKKIILAGTDKKDRSFIKKRDGKTMSEEYRKFHDILMRGDIEVKYIQNCDNKMFDVGLDEDGILELNGRFVNWYFYTEEMVVSNETKRIRSLEELDASLDGSDDVVKFKYHIDKKEVIVDKDKNGCLVVDGIATNYFDAIEEGYFFVDESYTLDLLQKCVLDAVNDGFIKVTEMTDSLIAIESHLGKCYLSNSRDTSCYTIWSHIEFIENDIRKTRKFVVERVEDLKRINYINACDYELVSTNGNTYDIVAKLNGGIVIDMSPISLDRPILQFEHIKGMTIKLKDKNGN